MAALKRRLATALSIAGLALAPMTAHAEPTFSCETRSLIIGAAEVNGLRVTCRVSGATDDQALQVVGDQPRPVCEADLTDGSGSCGGTVFGSPEVGHVVAVLMPSGTQFDVLTQQVNPTPPLRYFPLPENAGSTDQDEPAPSGAD